MNIEHLVKMANQIGSFFSTMPDRDQAIADLASHLKRFWEPRMRKAFLEHIEKTQGEGLDPIVLEAVNRHMQQLAV
ncbi:formate dehydrogenase subunit delta [Herbaspirillum huttiense]|jgi:formate dehydrogenase subunit delta|uniref:Formate dehydrogenase subunit delta n=3 Tax=Herbaspirillum huttiense TaxID=863372 RepID=A0AAJ2H7D1_9BURK|nr:MULTISPECIES: formate dehydrogenase subunit delta [Herbaspirillum]MBN9356285.1 formate dehydrogenase subunit delta [Herbaspirillum huttiense]MBP1315867.1 formate dehydrogenase subunit delta [Herbaspirillum sp. 1130]MCO4858143.1 formate dehydrogenase subunit delta [Herbaspirillum sp. WGmk3]MCP3655404.1 formate dehydrogenase subunit delta [Herbaspirillum sp.]MCP3947501.1 formate dehydrogenase subunit delta [Herbaspirillum sp.]